MIFRLSAQGLFELFSPVDLLYKEGNVPASVKESPNYKLNGAEFAKEVQTAYPDLFSRNLNLAILKRAASRVNIAIA